MSSTKEVLYFLIHSFRNQANTKVLSENKTTTACVAIVAVGAGYSIYKEVSRPPKEDMKTITRMSMKDKINVDWVFLNRMWQIFRILLPGVWNRTFGHLMSLTVLLWARTMLSLKVADIVGSNAQYIVQKNLKKIALGVIQFALIGIPASLVNSGLKYEVRMLSLLFRKSLTEHVQQQYLRGTNFYKASNLGGNNRIDNADQRVTQDIENFCDSLSDFYANFFKPILDVILNTYKLSTVLGYRGPIFLCSYYSLSAAFKRFLMPSFGRLTARLLN